MSGRRITAERGRPSQTAWVPGDPRIAVRRQRLLARFDAVDEASGEERLLDGGDLLEDLRRSIKIMDAENEMIETACHHTSRDCAFAASMKLANSGCGSNGRDLSSG